MWLAGWQGGARPPRTIDRAVVVGLRSQFELYVCSTDPSKELEVHLYKPSARPSHASPAGRDGGAAPPTPCKVPGRPPPPPRTAQCLVARRRMARQRGF
jgi:hypothetical protein